MEFHHTPLRNVGRRRNFNAYLAYVLVNSDGEVGLCDPKYAVANKLRRCMSDDGVIEKLAGLWRIVREIRMWKNSTMDCSILMRGLRGCVFGRALKQMPQKPVGIRQ